ncbi:class I SAM-dependent methyltransferase [Chloroflexota bacterium]
MVKPRVPETEDGIQDEFDVKVYDNFMRRMRNRGWIETKEVLNTGINSGLALELGPGPGYLGLEWLKKTTGTRLKGMDISQAMLEVARRNSEEYGLVDRVEYIEGDARKIPFKDAYFDAVFTNGSIHEWARPEEILNEINRVLKPGGRYCISDMKRNISPVIKWFLWIMTSPSNIRPYLISSINASYTREEMAEILLQTALEDWHIRENFIGLVTSGVKTLAA